jgi:hypothetical protein
MRTRLAAAVIAAALIATVAPFSTLVATAQLGDSVVGAGTAGNGTFTVNATSGPLIRGFPREASPSG